MEKSFWSGIKCIKHLLQYQTPFLNSCTFI